MALDPQMMIRIAANLDTLKSNMADARSNIASIKDSATEVSGALDNFAGVAERMGERIAAAFAIHEVISFAEDLFSAAHALEVLSLQTGINTTELQVLGAATKEFGLDTDQLGTLIFQLSRRIAGDDQSAATAIHMLGLSMGEVQKLDQEERFLAVARAMNTVTAATKDLAATDLFGGRGGKAVIAFSSDVDGSMQKVRDSLTVASGESIKRLAAMEDEVERAKTSFHNFATEAAGGFLQFLGILHTKVQEGTSFWTLLSAAVKDFGMSAVTGTASSQNLAAVLFDTTTKTDAATAATKAGTEAHKDALPVLSARQQAEIFMNSTRLDAAKPILEWQAADLAQLKEWGELTAKNAAAIGVSAGQLKIYEDGLKEAADVERELARLEAEAAKAALARWSELQRVTDEYYKAVNAASHDSVQKQIDDAYLAADAKIAAMEKAKTYSVEAEMIIWKTAEQTANNIIQKTLEQDVHTKAHFVLLADQARAAYDFAAAHSDQYTEDELRRLRDVADAAQLAAERFGMDFTNAAAKSSAAVQAAVTQIKASIASISIDPSTLSPEIGGTQGAPGSYQYEAWQQSRGIFFNNLPPAARAEGGPVTAGQVYTVGERGPETLVMGTSNGTILPNGAGGGPITITTQLVVDGRVLASVVEEHQTRQMRQGRQWPSA